MCALRISQTVKVSQLQILKYT